MIFPNMTDNIPVNDLNGFLPPVRIKVKAIAVFIEKKPFFGATLVNIPFLHALRGLYPGTKIVVLSTEPAAELLAKAGVADEFILYKWDFFGIRHTLRDISPELVFVLRPASRGLDLAVASCHIPESASFYSWLGRLLYSRIVPHNNAIYRARKFMTLVMEPAAARTAPLDGWFRGAAARAGLSTSSWGRTLAVLPGGGDGAYKLWGEENYLKLCADLARRDPELSFTWILGPQEAGLGKKIAASGLASRSRILSNASLPDLAAAAFASAGAVGNDCGPAHLFQMCGCPFICVMSDDTGVMPQDIGRGALCAAEWVDAPNRAFIAFSRPGEHISTVKVGTVLDLVLKRLPPVKS